MTEILRELWHEGPQLWQDSLAADGLPLPRRLDQPDPPTEDPSASLLGRGSLGPGRTSIYPTLYLSGVRSRVRCDAIQQGAIDARRSHWPPPLCCISMQPERDPALVPVDQALMPSPEGALDHPNARGRHAMDTTGFALLPPERTASMVVGGGEGPAPAPTQDKCYYALPIRPYRIVLFDESVPPVVVPQPRPMTVAEHEESGSEATRDNGGGGEEEAEPAHKRRRTTQQGGAATGSEEEEEEPIPERPKATTAAAKRASKKKKKRTKRKRVPRARRRRNGERGGPGGGIARRKRELESELARMPASRDNVRRLLLWQRGGVSLDGGERESGAGVSEGSVGPGDVPDPDREGVVRRVVYGVPVITLIDLGLLPDAPTPVVDRLCEQLGLSHLETRNTKQWKRVRSSQARTEDGGGDAGPAASQPPGMTKETLATIMFPPLDPATWRNEIQFQASASAAATQAISEHHFERLIGKAQGMLVDSGASQNEKQRMEMHAAIQEAHRVGPRYGPELLRVLLAMDVQRTKRPAKRGFHGRGWKHRIVPAFMLPFLLTQPALYHPYETASDPWYACIHVGHGLRLLGNASRSHGLERAMAWHDERLLTLTISMAWKQGRHQGQLALGFISELLGMRRDVLRLEDRIQQLDTAVFSDDDDDEDDDDDDEDVPMEEAVV